MFQSSSSSKGSSSYVLDSDRYGKSEAMKKSEDRRRTLLLAAAATTFVVVLCSYKSTWEEGRRREMAAAAEEVGDAAAERGLFESDKKVWVSMSVCYDEAEKKYAKKNFPYLLATELSVSLWLNKTSAGVIVQVIHNDSVSGAGLDDFLARLRNLGAVATAVPTDRDLGSCVLQSQLQRAFAFDIVAEDVTAAAEISNDQGSKERGSSYRGANSPRGNLLSAGGGGRALVDSDDVVVTSDVDVFVMDPELFSDLGRRDLYDTWVYQYETTVRLGVTFSMSFLAMTADGWRRLLAPAVDPRGLIQEHREYLTSRFQVWNYDQVLLSRLILERGLCRLPPHNPLWLSLGVSPVDAPADDRCFHGSGFQDCNRDRKSLEGRGANGRRGACRMWHFHPYEREPELRDKYEEILGVRPADTGMARTIKDVKLEMEKILGFRN